MTDEEMATKIVDAFLDKDDSELDNFLNENLGDLKLNKKQAGTILGLIKGVGICSFLAGLKAQTKWHELDWEKDFPEVDRLVRVRTRDESEYICQTYLYIPTEDEIGYGSTITQFEELNGDWIDDNEIEFWCYIEPFEE